jgi:hypothetical protein
MRTIALLSTLTSFCLPPMVRDPPAPDYRTDGRAEIPFSIQFGIRLPEHLQFTRECIVDLDIGLN